MNKVTIDVSSIMDNWHAYKQRTELRQYLFTLDGFRFFAHMQTELGGEKLQLKFYVDGDITDAQYTRASIFACFDDFPVSYSSGCEKTASLKELKDEGSALLLLQRNMNAGKLLHIKVTLTHSSTSRYTKFAQPVHAQLEKMHALSEREGDVTLVVNIEETQFEQLYSPPAKKQKAEDVEIKVSSVILRSASVVFDSMLKNGMREQNEKKIEIVAKSVDDVRALTYFMCTGELPFKRNALNLMQLAHYYQMDGLFEQCENEAIRTVSVKNFFEALNVFEKYQNTKACNALIEFAKKNKVRLKKSNGCDKIPFVLKCALFDAE